MVLLKLVPPLHHLLLGEHHLLLRLLIALGKELVALGVLRVHQVGLRSQIQTGRMGMPDLSLRLSSVLEMGGDLFLGLGHLLRGAVVNLHLAF